MFTKCCGSSSCPAKDPSDKQLDEVSYSTIGVASIDETMEPALEMLNTVIKVNNTLVQTVDTVKLCSATLMGAMSAELNVNGASVSFDVVKHGARKHEVAHVKGGVDIQQVGDNTEFALITGRPMALSAVEDANGALAKLNDALAEGGFTVAASAAGRLLVTTEDGATSKQLADAALVVTGFNNCFFRVRLQLMQMALADGLAGAVREMMGNVRQMLKAAKLEFSPSLDVDFEKLIEGELVIEPTLGVDASALLDLSAACPAKLKACLDALFGPSFLSDANPLGEGGLLATLIETAKECASLLSRFNAVKDGVMKLCNPSEVMAQAAEAGLDKMTAMRLPSKVAANAKTVAKTPIILADVCKTLKDVALEIKGAFSGEAKAEEVPLKDGPTALAREKSVAGQLTAAPAAAGA